jgi:hypothetical protein
MEQLLPNETGTLASRANTALQPFLEDPQDPFGPSAPAFWASYLLCWTPVNSIANFRSETLRHPTKCASELAGAERESGQFLDRTTFRA